MPGQRGFIYYLLYLILISLSQKPRSNNIWEKRRWLSRWMIGSSWEVLMWAWSWLGCALTELHPSPWYFTQDGLELAILWFSFPGGSVYMHKWPLPPAPSRSNTLDQVLQVKNLIRKCVATYTSHRVTPPLKHNTSSLLHEEDVGTNCNKTHHTTLLFKRFFLN